MLCCSNIVLTFLTRILTKLPKSAHFWLSFEPLEKSSFFQGWMPKHLDTAMVSGGQNSLKAIRKNHKSHNGWKDSKCALALAVFSAENPWFIRVFAGSNFKISYRSCLFFLHFLSARKTVEIHGELSEWSKVRHSKSWSLLGSSLTGIPWFYGVFRVFLT